MGGSGVAASPPLNKSLICFPAVGAVASFTVVCKGPWKVCEDMHEGLLTGLVSYLPDLVSDF